MVTLVTFGILAAGLFVVVGGILFLRLHAFVALILAALLVAALTSRDAIIRSQVVATSVLISPVDGDPQRLSASRELNTEVDWVALPEPGAAAAEHGPRKLRVEPIPAADSGPLYRLVTTDGPPGGEVELAGEGTRLVTATEYAGAAKTAGRPAVVRVSESLGASCGRLAILIIAAAIIGECLLQSGAADRVVQSALAVFGQSGSPVAFVGSGFLLAIPVFFDTVFLLMVPLARSLYQRTRADYLLYILSIVVGATMAHSLVPPTPGPLLIAEAFQVPLSSMILGGSVVGVIAASAGLAYAYLVNRRGVLIPPERTDLLSPQSDPEATDGRGERRVPSLGESLLPVLLPVALMTLETRYDSAQGRWDLGPIHLPSMVSQVLAALCEKNMALIVGAVCSVWTLVRFRHPTRAQLAATIQQAIGSAGTIILVTAAGGAFGQMMQQTSVAELLQQIPAASPAAIVIAAFLVTAAVRTAQGSATVAMITAGGVFGGIVTSGAAGVDPLYVALSVGCGSKALAWMNDSGFLVITRMSGMTEAEGLRYVTPMMLIAALAGLITVLAGVTFLPDPGL